MYKDYKKGIYFQKVYGYYSEADSDSVTLTYKMFNVKNADDDFLTHGLYIVGEQAIKVDKVEITTVASNKLYEEKSIEITFGLEGEPFTLRQLRFVYGEGIVFDVGELIIEQFEYNNVMDKLSLRYYLFLNEPNFLLTAENLTDSRLDLLGLFFGQEKYGETLLEAKEKTDLNIPIPYHTDDFSLTIVKPIIRYKLDDGITRAVTTLIGTQYGNFLDTKDGILSFLKSVSNA
jgi:hypothetical protein